MPLAGVHIHVRNTGEEIPNLAAQTYHGLEPHVQTEAHLKDAGDRALVRVWTAQLQVIGHPKCPMPPPALSQGDTAPAPEMFARSAGVTKNEE